MVVLPAAIAARVRELSRNSDRPRRGRAFRRQLSELLGRQRHARRCEPQQVAVQEAPSCSPACLARGREAMGQHMQVCNPRRCSWHQRACQMGPASLKGVQTVAMRLTSLSKAADMCVGAVELA